MNIDSSNKVLKYLILTALVLLIVSIANLFFGGSSFKERDVVLELEVPEQAMSGDEITYLLKYENKTRLDLKNLRFIMITKKKKLINQKELW